MGGDGVSYVLPLRWGPGGPVAEMTTYLASLAPWVEVLVVDGSIPEVFTEHAAAWGALVRHLRPQPWPGRNGKVAGVVTGVRHATHDTVVLADDDVRYTPGQLRTVADRLAGVDLVRPQNVFSPLPWHARWDSARSLCNRAFSGTIPGRTRSGGTRSSRWAATTGTCCSRICSWPGPSTRSVGPGATHPRCSSPAGRLRCAGSSGSGPARPTTGSPNRRCWGGS